MSYPRYWTYSKKIAELIPDSFGALICMPKLAPRNFHALRSCVLLNDLGMWSLLFPCIQVHDV